MNFYIGSTENTVVMNALFDNFPLDQINLLVSFEYKKSLLGRKPTQFKNFISDSGAFTAMNTGKKIDDNYIRAYAEWVKENHVKNYMEMDLDEVNGYKQVLKIRDKLESAVGYQSIPVWHMERGLDGWKQMCRDYSYVALSMSGYTKVSKWFRKNKYKPLRTLLDISSQSGTKVHALGCNQIELMKQYRFHSCDNSMIAGAARFGRVYQFKNGKFVVHNSRSGKMIDCKKGSVQNAIAFMEATRYAEKWM